MHFLITEKRLEIQSHDSPASRFSVTFCVAYYSTGSQPWLHVESTWETLKLQISRSAPGNSYIIDMSVALALESLNLR